VYPTIADTAIAGSSIAQPMRITASDSVALEIMPVPMTHGAHAVVARGEL
jgi:hypothetical protein